MSDDVNSPGTAETHRIRVHDACPAYTFKFNQVNRPLALVCWGESKLVEVWGEKFPYPAILL